VPQVVTCKALSLTTGASLERHHLSGCLSAFLSTKKIKETMDKETLDKGNKLQNNIKFLQEKKDALFYACQDLIQENVETMTNEQMTKLVWKLMESFEGSMALTDIVRVVTDDYERKIKAFQQEFDEL
jgi:hypothetical protein